MSIRGLIFVIGMTIVLFFVNQYFTPQPQRGYASKRADVEQLTPSTKGVDLLPLPQIVSPEQLPLTGLYEDLQGRTLLSHSVIASKGSYLTIKWSDIMPKQIYVQKGNRFVPVYLVGEGNRIGMPALYSSAHKPEVISIHLSTTSRQAVQCVSFDRENVSVVLGLYENHTLSFPEGAPNSPAIALYQTENSYLPIGIYTNEKRSFQPLSTFQSLEKLIDYSPDVRPPQALNRENLYVLENNSVQIVFSNQGGAIAEINLPFKGKSDESVVLPIDFDRIIDKKYPSNARFPMRSFYLAQGEGSAPKLQNPVQGGYYPLLRRGISKQANDSAVTVSPEYYAFNVISKDMETFRGFYEVTHFDQRSIEFTATFQNRRITKTYAFPKEEDAAPYSLFATVQVDGNAQGLSVTSGVPEVELISGTSTPTIKYKTVQNYKEVVEKLSVPKSSTTLSSIQPDWVANSNGYFAIIMDPLSEIAPGLSIDRVQGNIDPSRITMVDSRYDLYPASRYPGCIAYMPLASTSQPIHFRLFMGPLQHQVLKQVDETFTNQVTGYNPNYVKTQSFHGWFAFISEPFAKFLFLILNFCYKITHSWGFSIILLTVILRVIMYPLNAWSIKSSLKLQALAPEMKKIQEKYKTEPRQQQIEMMQLYKKHKANPFQGCLPLIIQMPFLVGMLDLLKSTFALRGVPFIPGWIDNLTAPDALLTWEYPIPFVGTTFHLLPILLGIVMFLQQKFEMAKNKGHAVGQQQTTGLLITCVFTVLFYKMPSGLNIYFLSSMLLQIFQRWYSHKRAQLKKRPAHSREIVIKPKKSK